MLSSDQWKAKVVETSNITCCACGSTDMTMGACAVGVMTIHQEYTCESCGHEFTAMYALVGYYDGLGMQ